MIFKENTRPQLTISLIMTEPRYMLRYLASFQTFNQEGLMEQIAREKVSFEQIRTLHCLIHVSTQIAIDQKKKTFIYSDKQPDIIPEYRSRILGSLLCHSGADLEELSKDYFPKSKQGVSEQFFRNLEPEELEDLLTQSQDKFEDFVEDRAQVLTE